MKNVKKYLVVVSLLMLSQNAFSTADIGWMGHVKSDHSFSTAFVPVQVVADIVEVAAEELLNLK